MSSILGSQTLHAGPKSQIYDFKSLSYDASKAALNSFTIHLARELKDTKIKVNSAHPGWVKTDMGTDAAPMEIPDGAKTGLELARLGENGPTGGFFHLGNTPPGNNGRDGVASENLCHHSTMLYFTESDIRSLLPMREAIRLMQTAFERLAKGEAINQPRRRLILPAGSVLHYMASSDGPYFGAKIYSAHARHGAHFLFLLYRSEDAQPLALMEANYLGQIRTGAVSGLATRYMARADADTLAIVGSGFQARSQLSAMLEERSFRWIRIWSRDAAKRSAFAAECSAAFRTKVEAGETAAEVVRGAGIVVTATNAKDPVLEADWIEAGTHINAMGSNQAKRRELPSNLMHHAHWIAVDSIEQARTESGDLLLALDEEGWRDSKLLELKDVVSGDFKRRPTDITIFKSNGLAIEDVICAGYVYEMGLKQGRGAEMRYS